MRRRIGFFGGSFDPVHRGHVAMAESALAALDLHQVVFIPVASNPHREQGPTASGIDRLEMLRLALRGDARFSIWDGELERAGTSYTYDSVVHLERVYPNAHHFWIIGSDQCAGLQNWHRIGELVQRLPFILVRRPRYPLEWPSIPGLRMFLVDNPEWEVSSTAVRLALNKKHREQMLTPAVEDYIWKMGLYQN